MHSKIVRMTFTAMTFSHLKSNRIWSLVIREKYYIFPPSFDEQDLNQRANNEGRTISWENDLQVKLTMHLYFGKSFEKKVFAICTYCCRCTFILQNSFQTKGNRVWLEIYFWNNLLCIIMLQWFGFLYLGWRTFVLRKGIIKLLEHIRWGYVKN
jgi:hypothetical protein